MKTLERGFGVDIAWNHARVESGDYDLIHTRSSHMAADIFTKPFPGPAPWTRLRRLINIYSPQELAEGWLSPDQKDYPAKDIEGIDEPVNHLNPHYTYIMSGASTLKTDFRKPIKKKPPCTMASRNIERMNIFFT